MYVVDDEGGNEVDKLSGIKKHDRVVCHECGNLITLQHLDTHMKEVHYYMSELPDPSILCPKCGIFSPDHRAFAKHVRTHYYSCNLCPALFETEDGLSKHGAAHEKKHYECDKCQTKFDDTYTFVVHKERHENTGKYRCVKCEYSTAKAYFLKRHLKQHDGRPFHTCEICLKKFFCKAQFDAHVGLHTGIKKYDCEYCSKKFLAKHYLKTHKDLNHHRELYGYEVSYSCRECGRKFTFESSLRRHLSTIHKIGKDRTVSCPVCLKVIANNYNLSVHMRLHTGEKTNVCENCGKAYHTYKSYKKHVLKHHPGVKPVPKTESKRSKPANG